MVLLDEVLTPDSSRFWSADSYAVGRGQSSFDKQYLRGTYHDAQAEAAWISFAKVFAQIGWCTMDLIEKRE